MMFIVRTAGECPPCIVKMTRRTPVTVPDSAGCMDYFCLGDSEKIRTAGWEVIPTHDGWYADEHGGGIAIWGQGTFWEVRATPFQVTEACDPTRSPLPVQGDDDVVNVRAAIFRG